MSVGATGAVILMPLVFGALVLALGLIFGRQRWAVASLAASIVLVGVSVWASTVSTPEASAGNQALLVGAMGLVAFSAVAVVRDRVGPIR